MSYGGCELWSFGVKVALVIVTYLQPHLPAAGSLGKVAAAVAFCALQLYYAPFSRLVTNQARLASFTFFLWWTAMESTVAFGADPVLVGQITLLGMVPSALVGWAVTWVQWKRVAARLALPEFVGAALRGVPLTARGRASLRAVLWDLTSLDIAVRCIMHSDALVARTWGGCGFLCGWERPGTEADPLQLSASDRLHTALWLFDRAFESRPLSPRLWVTYLNYCHENHVPPSHTVDRNINALDVRFVVFRLQFEERRATLDKGVGTVQYLDLHTTLRTAGRWREEAAQQLRSLWDLLLKPTPPSTVAVTTLLRRASRAEQRARAAFNDLLRNHGYSSQVSVRMGGVGGACHVSERFHNHSTDHSFTSTRRTGAAGIRTLPAGGARRVWGGGRGHGAGDGHDGGGRRGRGGPTSCKLVPRAIIERHERWRGCWRRGRAAGGSRIVCGRRPHCCHHCAADHGVAVACACTRPPARLGHGRGSADARSRSPRTRCTPCWRGTAAAGA